MPQNAAGQRTEPPVSVPSARSASPAATEAAEPPEEPPGTREISRGLRVGPKAEFSVVVPMPNSSMLVLPLISPPAAFTSATAWASYGGTYSARIREPQDVGHPAVEMLSLTATVRPASGPVAAPGIDRHRM